MINPPGSLPGMSNLATAPARNPMIIVQIKCSIPVMWLSVFSVEFAKNHFAKLIFGSSCPTSGCVVILSAPKPVLTRADLIAFALLVASSTPLP